MTKVVGFFDLLKDKAEIFYEKMRERKIFESSIEKVK